MLRVYNTADYKETQIMRGEIEGFLGEWNLAKLKPAGEINRFTVSQVHTAKAFQV
jgi:hypothetical protein